MTQRHSIDSLAFRKGMVFGWGWFLDDDLPAARCELDVPMKDGSTQRIRCVPGGMRDDLKSAFPGVGHAASAGFIIRGHLRGPADETTFARLICTLVNGETHVREVHGFPSRYVANWEARGRARWVGFRERWVSDGFGKAVSHQWGRVRNRWQRWLSYFDMAMALRKRGETIVVFDHAMGGGANRYCQDMIAGMLADSRPVALVTFRLATLDYSLSLRWSDQRVEVVHEHLHALLRQFALADISEVHINNLVSFADPIGVVRWARERKQGHGSGIVLHLHDYYAICPSWTLIDVGGKFCGLPALDVCRKCLPANTAHTLSLAPEMEVEQWRQEWQGLLEMADRIIGFSNASVNILKTAYPMIDKSRITVQPHVVDAASLRQAQPVFGEVLVIGVIGHISAAKGALVLQQMAHLIKEESRPVRIVVLGTLEYHHVGDGIEVTGEYQGSRLPDLLEQHGVGVCMLPSVCAETFSYVTAEIMAMQMPLAVFGLGAPAERARRYDRGLVISQIDAETALDEIQSFASRLSGKASATTKRNGH